MLYDKKKNYASLLLLINITLFAFPVQANLSHQYDKCVGDSGNNVTIGTCLTIEEEYQNKRFNKYYHQLLKLLTKPQKQAFILAQKSWADFHENEWGFWFTIYTKTDDDADLNPSLGLEMSKDKLIRFSERNDKIAVYIDERKKGKQNLAMMTEGLSDAFYKCIDDNTHFISEICADNERNYQNEQLNQVYKMFLSILNKNQKEDLVNYQKYWFLFYQNEFSFRNALNSKNDPLLSSSLRVEKLNLIVERTHQLKKLMGYKKSNNELTDYN